MPQLLKRPSPVDQESKFLINELFFSKTDFKGRILTGNSVFTRVSQYTKEELIGQPHNVIRHPDMPRIVFKVLWDYIEAGKMVGAYVKNLTKQGHYYWVLAVVFPVKEGYLSIRIKPSSPYFDVVKDLYKVLLEVEGDNGDMMASGKLLNETLHEKGFENYDKFLAKVLLEELNSRESLIESSEEDTSTNSGTTSVHNRNNLSQQDMMSVFNQVREQCDQILTNFKELYVNFDILLKIEAVLSENTNAVLDFSESMSMLSLNVGIECHRVGHEGKTLSVIAKEIKSKSEIIGSLAQLIRDFSSTVTEQAEIIGLCISLPRLQSEMVNFFASELHELNQRECTSVQDFDESRANIKLLCNLFLNQFDELTRVLDPLRSNVENILKHIHVTSDRARDIEKALPAGNIEAARIGEIGLKFVHTFQDIQQSTEVIEDKLANFAEQLNSILKVVDSIGESNEGFIEAVGSINVAMDNVELQDEGQSEEEIEEVVEEEIQEDAQEDIQEDVEEESAV